MKTLIEGHLYELENFENKDAEGQRIQFIQKEPTTSNDGTMKTVSDGTTMEDVIEVLIDRLKGMQKKFPCKENACATTHLEEALMWLEKRTAERKKRNVEGKHLA
jgi:hypothetical protein